MFFQTCKQPVITWRKIWRVGRMCHRFPVPLLHQILHIMMVMCCVVLENMTPCSIIYGCLWWRASLVCPERVSSNIHRLLFQLARDGKAEIHFGWRVWCAWVPSTLIVLCSFLPRWLWSVPFIILLFQQGRGCQVMAVMTPWHLKCNGGMHCHHFSSGADGWCWDEHARPFGHCGTCVDSTLHILNVSISCWWGCSKHLLDRFQLL